MISNTNLEKVKETAKMLLFLDVTELDYGICTHPFISNRYTFINNKPIDIFESQENLDKIRKFYMDRIDMAKDIHYILMLMHRPYRSLLFKLTADYLSREDYNKVLNYVWTDSENPNQDVNVSIKEWISFFKKADKYLLMTKQDYEKYISLKDGPIDIYRGVGKGREPMGLSWTDELEVAKWFAKRWGDKDAYMFKGQIYKRDVLAYLNDRNEKEFVVNVKEVFNIERVEI